MNADILIRSDAVFDSIQDNPFSGAVAIRGNRIVGVEKGSDGFQWIGPETKVFEVADKLVMAGFHDSHTHLLMAGMYKIFVNLMDAKSEEETVEMVKAAYDRGDYKDMDWVIGFSWYHVFWEHKIPPTKASLDAAFPDVPVFLLNAEAHGAWVNSKALAIAGVTKDTPDPEGGFFGRDETGEPTGFLYEAAVGPVAKYALSFTTEQEKRFIRAYMDAAAPYGITSLNDVQPYFHGNMGNLETYSELDQTGELTVRLHVAPDLLGDLDEVVRWREFYKSDKLRVDMVKQFLDGVSTTHTALVLEEYTDAPGNFGISLTDVEAIKRSVPEAHRRGLSIKLHSCGDKSARMAMDFYEDAIKQYGRNECRHAIEHLEMVAEEDRPRMRDLGIIPSMQPEHLAMTQTFAENPYQVTIGPERSAKGWPWKTLLDLTGVIAIGSDCPVVDNSPFLEIFRAITRVHNDGEPKGGWNPTEKLTLTEVLRGYTYGSAYGVRREAELGSLEAGKFADLVVLDRNLFRIDPWEILEAKVALTIMDGKIVHSTL